jgi:F-type H+-transporting ATPase subunit gamma
MSSLKIENTTSSLKDIKKRINSVKSTQKTTSAMKMVSSSKLRKAEFKLANFRRYSEATRHILESLLTSDYAGSFYAERPVNNVVLIAFSSDSSLCGAFNSNISRELQKTINKYKNTSVPEHPVNISVYTIGKKVYESIRRAGIPVTQNFENLAGKPDYSRVIDFASTIISQFVQNRIDRVDLIYHHFKSAGVQALVNEPLLPLKLPAHQKETDYLIEPSREDIFKTMIPYTIQLRMYKALLDSNTSEHAARMIAMQTATDNADDLISGLTIEYNKSRQQAITNELLDLIGGSAQ